MLHNVLSVILILLSLVFSIFSHGQNPEVGPTLEIKIEGTVGPATVDFYQRVAEQCINESCSSMLLLINTPGGSLQSTRLLVEQIIASPVPVLCLVHPSGGRAGSAGALILLACHLSGATVATNLGAATPVSGQGQEMPEDLRKKILNDTISWMEGVTKLRNRSQQFAREIILDAKSVTAEEAKEQGAIEYVANNKAEFLEFARGKEVTLSTNMATLIEVGAVKTIDPGLRERVVELIADPQFAYLLLMGSLGLLYYEITHPGMIVPGVVGAVGFVLAMMAMHKLEVEYAGLVLILLGIIFMIAEAFVPSFGFLGIGGVVSFLLGSLFLFDEEKTGMSLPLTVIIPTTIVFGVIAMGLAYLASSTMGRRRQSDFEVLIGKTGEVVKLSGANKGMVFVFGENWVCEADEELQLKDKVEVTGHRGMTLLVKKKA